VADFCEFYISYNQETSDQLSNCKLFTMEFIRQFSIHMFVTEFVSE
jgi:hypothetical protein